MCTNEKGACPPSVVYRRDWAPFIHDFLTACGVLLALVAVLAQALLALVRSHLVALLLFSVWHSGFVKILMCVNNVAISVFICFRPSSR
jgi:hypothetical protein